MNIHDLIAIIPVLLAIGLILFIIVSVKKHSISNAAVFAVVGIITVSAIAIPLVTAFNNDVVTDTIYYDDYIQTNDVVSATGSIEYITVGSDKYLHAKSTGSGTVIYSNGTSIVYHVEKAILDVFLFIGQSNISVNYGSDASTAPVPNLGTCYYYGTNNHIKTPWVSSACSMHSMSSDNGDSANVGGIDVSFGVEYHKLTGHKVYVINGAYDGTKIESWTPTKSSFVYAQSVYNSAYSEIDTALFTPSLKCYVWGQGEFDSATSVSSYKGDFNLMHDAILNGTFSVNGKFTECMIMKTKNTYGNAPIAQKELANEISTVYLATERADTFDVGSDMMYDHIHYSQKARNLLGIDLATFYVQNLL